MLRPRILILGGTTEATALARALDRHVGYEPCISLAGRTANPVLPIANTRIGGFGGADGLVAHLRAQRIAALVDATHPFAAQISRNAAAAAIRAQVPILALLRPAWAQQPGDNWIKVSGFAEAAVALAGPAQRVFLAIGRLELAAFDRQLQHHYLLRTIDAPDPMPDWPSFELIFGRGPFSLAGEIDLLRNHNIDIVVTKNAGSAATYAKVEAARQLSLPVIMIDRPERADTPQVADVEAAMNWLAVHAPTTS